MAKTSIPQVESVSLETRIALLYETFREEHCIPHEIDDELFSETMAAVSEAIGYLSDEEISTLTQADLYGAVKDYLEEVLDRLVGQRRRFRAAYEEYTRPYKG